MSESSTPPHAPDAPPPAPAPPESDAAAELTQQFEAYKKRLLGQIAEWGTHVDGVQQKLTAAATQARLALEKELSEVKAHHPSAFARMEELRSSGDESLAELRGRLDRLSTELEKAVGSFLGSLSEQAKRVTSSAPATPPAAPPAAAPPAAASPAAASSESSEPPTDKPAA